MANSIAVSIIIVSYNTKDFLRNCLASLQKNVSTQLSYEVIVVDNASIDGSSEMVKQYFPSVKIIENAMNHGFSKANNIGLNQAQGEYILFLNSDTVVPQNTIEFMYTFMQQHPDAGASTCYLKLPHGSMDDACHRGFPTPWNAFCHFSGLAARFPTVKKFNGYSLNYMDLTKTHEIDALAGAFMFVRRKAGEEVSWWDEDYFFYGEDIEFCYMLKERGWKIYFVPAVEILHYKGISGGIKAHSEDISTADLETKKRVTEARFNAMKIFYNKHYIKKYPKPLTWLVFKGINWKMQKTLKALEA